MSHVLQHVLFPLERDPDILPLYADPETWTVIRRQPVQVSSEAHVNDILSRTSYRIRRGQRVSFASYFNAFPAAYWQRWTVVEAVRLALRTSGAGTVIVYRSNSQGVQQRIGAAVVKGSQEVTFDLSLRTFGDGGWYWFDVVAGDEDVVIEGGEWTTGSDPVTTGNTSLGITTFNKPDYCVQTLATLASQADVLAEIDTIYVVDQGDQKVADRPELTEIEQQLGDQLRIVDQANLGGSGGFSRAMSETLDAGRSDFLLLLDDDVEIEPESIYRSVQFSRFCRTPTIVGSHMFDLLDKPILHAFSETVDTYYFIWRSALPKQVRHDFRRSNLRQTPWMHQRLDPDYNGWWMCMIPTKVIREVGLSVPVFIKWDDAEYALRARDHGYGTVSLPGSALWHVSWVDKDDSQDWQAYYHARNRLLTGLLHSPHAKGGKLISNSGRIDLKHLLTMQYYAATLRHRAIRDLLQGPEHLHRTMASTMPELRAATADFVETQIITDPDDLPATWEGKQLFPDDADAEPRGARLALFTLRAAARHWRHRVPQGNIDRPQVELAKADASWWRVPSYDSALISSADGRGKSVYQRDRTTFRRLWRESRKLHRELEKNWDRLAREYRAALPDVTSQEAWRPTFTQEP
ncbi:glycosyltransferase [Aeromicrobium sp. CTD01-1L150]|uniref:glycosyltransferase n=1 Tax=Aeromicrobium sp. CTD01-1L150 TaxID=3341830 RepID=UPI0035C1C17E